MFSGKLHVWIGLLKFSLTIKLYLGGTKAQ